MLASDQYGNKYDDLLAVDPENTLRIYPGNATGTFGGSADIVARDGGFLYWYPGKGAGGFGQRIKVGEGWGSFEFAGGDADGAVGRPLNSPRHTRCWDRAAPDSMMGTCPDPAVRPAARPSPPAPRSSPRPDG